MKIKEPCTKRCLIIFAAVFLCQYAIEHCAYMLTDAAYAGSLNLTAPALLAIHRTVGYIIDAAEICSAAAAALIVLLRLINSGALKSLVLASAILATKLLYVLPHYYMTVISYGYDSIEALLLSLLSSLAMLLTLLAEISAAVAIGALPAILAARRGGVDYRELLADGLSERELSDVGNHGTAAMLIASAVISVKSVILAIVDTVGFFSVYGSSYSFGDIFRVLFGIIYPIILIFVAYTVMQYLKCRIVNSEQGNSCDDDTDSAK